MGLNLSGSAQDQIRSVAEAVILQQIRLHLRGQRLRRRRRNAFRAQLHGEDRRQGADLGERRGVQDVDQVRDDDARPGALQRLDDVDRVVLELDGISLRKDAVREREMQEIVRAEPDDREGRLQTHRVLQLRRTLRKVAEHRPETGVLGVDDADQRHQTCGESRAAARRDRTRHHDRFAQRDSGDAEVERFRRRIEPRLQGSGIGRRDGRLTGARASDDRGQRAGRTRQENLAVAGRRDQRKRRGRNVERIGAAVRLRPNARPIAVALRVRDEREGRAGAQRIR